MAPLHNRMPVILPRAVWRQWLGEEEETPLDAAAELLAPYRERLVLWPVHKDVGNVKNDRPDLIEPVGTA
jgi:putative SOS response-associated peptidase YedK